MTTNQTIDGVPRVLVRENIAYLRGIGGTHDQKSALAAKFELLLLDHSTPRDLREQYESWADSNGYDIARNEHGDYAGIVEDSMWTGWQARGELRALLDAKPETVAGHHPACRAVDDYKPGECSHSCKPAAQPQGEPVAWMSRCLATGQCEQVSGPEEVNNLEYWSPAFPVYAEQPAPVAVLAEAREWLGDGKHADGMAREHWTPEYAALIDRVDATLRK